MILGISSSIKGEINPASFKEISKINNNGPYIGIVVPNPYELEPLLTSSSFVAHSYFDIAGRHFRIGELASKKVIVVMSGLGMINAALATELQAI
ncbi:hypothetical protein P8452_18671 [Trifolium repens]|nr:hypothetical protein P8452_18671 [Trifolium repens]